jgi:hypothetical protein
VSLPSPGDAPLPDKLPWHSAMFFSDLDGKWRSLFAVGTRPVLIEKQHGLGSIVLLADSYLLSNEAMRVDRQAVLLSWLLGRSKSVVFDETHFGVTEKPGVMALARKYRLHGLMIGLIFLAGLFVWKNSSPFAPGSSTSSTGSWDQPVGGRDSTTGFIKILRRSVAAANLSTVCFEQWMVMHTRDRSRAKLERMQTLVQAEQTRPPRERDPVRTYQQLARIWNERKL